MSSGLHRRETAALRWGLYAAYLVLIAGLAFTLGAARPWLGWLVALVAVGVPTVIVLRWHFREEEIAASRADRRAGLMSDDLPPLPEPGDVRRDRPFGP